MFRITPLSSTSRRSVSNSLSSSLRSCSRSSEKIRSTSPPTCAIAAPIALATANAVWLLLPALRLLFVPLAHLAFIASRVAWVAKPGAGSDTSLFSNLNLILGAGGQVWGAVGSSYTYDALFTSDAPDMVIAGFEALFGAGGGSSALAGLLAGDLSVELFVQSLVPGPWTIAILAIQLSGILSCEQAEQILAMKRDNRPCHGVGSYCSARVPIIRLCIETTQSYCCFNSRLSRILNEQGRAQLGKGWGGAESPDCSGFTMPQLQALDFSRMDLAEFYAEIAPTLPDTGAMQQRAQQKVNSYFAP